MNIPARRCSLWQDGVLVGQLTSTDFDAGQQIGRFTGVQERLGAPFSGVVEARFGEFQAWLGAEFTPEQVAAL
jgi:hypothetical protein